MNEELLPCPFCGGKAEVANDAEIELGSEGVEEYSETGAQVYWVECKKCDAYVASFKRDEAIAAWNKRTSEEANP